MIITLLAWLYITFICWSYGILAILLIGLATNTPVPRLYQHPVICLIGLSIITLITGCISLIFPLGNVGVQVVVALPALVVFYRHCCNQLWRDAIKNWLPSYHSSILVLLISTLCMILITSVYQINHPDTLGYHAQTIQWIEKYRAVPGLVHLNVRLGYQGLWYVVCAFLSFSFLPIKALTFINTTVLIWFVFFITQKINDHLKTDRNKIRGILYLLLLLFCCWSFTAIRLTALSASPDFIAAIYAWAAFYLLVTKKNNPIYQLVGVILICTGITFKLATAPLFLLIIYIVYLQLRAYQFKRMILTFFISVLFFIPFISRNIITTGYVLFPLPVTSISTVDWAFSKQQATRERAYIKAYARIAKAYPTYESISHTNEMKLQQWLPRWWKERSRADQVLLLLIPLLTFYAASIYKSSYYSYHNPYLIYSILAIAGLLFWFVSAPDPRFGYGFIIPIVGLSLSLILHRWSFNNALLHKLLLAGTLFLSLTLIGYSAYRFRHFFRVENILYPSGIINTTYSTFYCGGILFSVPEKNSFFTNIPIPATYEDSCRSFVPRSTNIVNGFKSRYNKEQ